MQVILLERIAKLGQMGDIVEVKSGYARNFLLPFHKALRATEKNIKFFEEQKSIFTVRECDHTPLQANILPENNSMKNFVPKKYKWLNRQEMPVYYQLSGSVCVSEWDVFIKEKTFLNKP